MEEFYCYLLVERNLCENGLFSMVIRSGSMVRSCIDIPQLTHLLHSGILAARQVLK
jgi:hypothetical protein